MNNVKVEKLVLGILVAVENGHWYSARLPSKMTVKKFAQDEAAIKALQGGLYEAAGLAFLTTAAIAWLAKSWAIFFIGTVVNGFMYYLYNQDIEEAKRERAGVA